MSVYILFNIIPYRPAGKVIVAEIEENDDKVRSVYGGSVGEA